MFFVFHFVLFVIAEWKVQEPAINRAAATFDRSLIIASSPALCRHSGYILMCIYT